MSLDLESVMSLISSCGDTKLTIVSPDGSIIRDIVKYCDNKACNNPECMVHRRYQYVRHHKEQIEVMSRNIRVPKAWVFTGWRLPYPIDREFCREKLRDLFHLLNSSSVGSVTNFSIHMEVKLHKDSWYLHFHVVSGGLRNYRFVRYLWGRHVFYELAIRPRDLEMYISKYASKTPLFEDDVQRLMYLKYIYKTKTTRFSYGKSGYVPSGWYLMDQLEWEAYCVLKEDNDLGIGYSPFVDLYYAKRHKPTEPVFDVTGKDYFAPDNFCSFMEAVKAFKMGNYKYC